jgi:NTP pyrophosphatase (non-canonical NTP hydrolase)
MASFRKEGSIADFQAFISDVYRIPDDRMFSVLDLVSNMERFTMRAIKGIRKNDMDKLRMNLMIALSWYTAIANRLNIDLEKTVWDRFPGVCSYCGKCPCACSLNKQQERASVDHGNDASPKTLDGFQALFARIYPPAGRSLEHAGIHLAEEMGEVSEAISIFLGEHRPEQFESITCEMADYFSCLFGVTNSANINVASSLAEYFSDNCNACHRAPCECGFSFIAKFHS